MLKLKLLRPNIKSEAYCLIKSSFSPFIQYEFLINMKRLSSVRHQRSKRHAVCSFRKEEFERLEKQAFYGEVREDYDMKTASTDLCGSASGAAYENTLAARKRQISFSSGAGRRSERPYFRQLFCPSNFMAHRTGTTKSAEKSPLCNPC